MRKLLVRAVLATVAAASGVAIAAGPVPDPVVGTWQLNVSKSTFTAGPAFKSQARTYSQSGQSITLVMKTVGADGKDVTTQTTYISAEWPGLPGDGYPRLRQSLG